MFTHPNWRVPAPLILRERTFANPQEANLHAVFILLRLQKSRNACSVSVSGKKTRLKNHPKKMSDCHPPSVSVLILQAFLEIILLPETITVPT